MWLATRLDEKIDGLAARQDEKIDGLAARQDEKIDSLSARVGRVEEGQAQLSEQLGRQEQEQARMNGVLETLPERLGRLEQEQGADEWDVGDDTGRAIVSEWSARMRATAWRKMPNRTSQRAERRENFNAASDPQTKPRPHICCWPPCNSRKRFRLPLASLRAFPK